MKKIIIILSASLAVAAPLHAQWEVHNGSQDLLLIEQQVERIAHYIELATNQVKQWNTLKEELDRLQFVSRAMGDPATNTWLPAIKSVAASIEGKSPALTRLDLIGATGAQLAQDDIGGGLYRAVGATFNTRDNQAVRRVEQAYKPLAAVVQATANHDAVQADVKARREQLRAGVRQALEQLRVAKTDAETQKLQGVLVGLNAELAAADAELAAAAQQAVVQEIANRNDRLRQEQAHREEQAAEFQATVEKVTAALRPNTKPVSLSRPY